MKPKNSNYDEPKKNHIVMKLNSYCDETKKNSNCDKTIIVKKKTKTQNVTRLKLGHKSWTQIKYKKTKKNSNCDKTQKLKFCRNSNCDEIKNSNWDETQKLKLWQNSDCEEKLDKSK